jgi:diguanylate cyclase (GGDEF)-like protein/PAS domain S-box-containing protein
LLIGAVLSLTTFLELKRRSTFWRAVFILFALAGCALLGFAWQQPVVATGIARLAFAGVVALGMTLCVVYWLRGFMRAQSTMLPWTTLTVWTLVAALAVLGQIRGTFLAPGLFAGLVIVLVTMAFCLAQFAFDHSVGSYQFMRDTGRRALALAGSEQAVWDWNAGDAVLYVGPELERTLGLAPGVLSGADLTRWLDIIHPADRAAYVSGVEAAERRGKGAFTQEFRLRRSDGSYRWYMLRARSMRGDNGHAARVIGTLADITADKRAEERLLSDAVRDRVTNLPNKALLLDRLQRALTRAIKLQSNELYAVVVDLDRFKSINEGLGHEVGDSILNIVARRLGDIAGPEDSVGRLPGDRFALVVQSSNPPRDMADFTEAVSYALHQPIRLRDREILVTASIGVAQLSDSRDSAEDLLKSAEIALYEAKRAGTGMVQYFHANMRNPHSRLIAIEQDLRRAVQRNEIEVFYQPLMRLRDDQLAGFEALVRWRHPVEGILEPGRFMGVAEETGIIRDIGRVVLNEAGRQLGIWQRAFRPHDPLFVAVNLSSVELLDADLVSEAKGLLTREDIQPGTLKLELTETMVMQNPELSISVLDKLRQLGIGLACDDFGTGYSALANLARLPFDTLKIDKSFLEFDGEDDRAAVILDSIILMAHDLELTVVAEGVENAEQVERLRELECDYVQGYYIGQPVTASQVLNSLGGMPYTAAGAPARQQFWDRLRGLGRASLPPDEHVPPAPAATDEPVAPQAQPVQEQWAATPEPEPVATQAAEDDRGLPEPEPAAEVVEVSSSETLQWPPKQCVPAEPESPPVWPSDNEPAVQAAEPSDETTGNDAETSDDFPVLEEEQVAVSEEEASPAVEEPAPEEEETPADSSQTEIGDQTDERSGVPQSQEDEAGEDDIESTDRNRRSEPAEAIEAEPADETASDTNEAETAEKPKATSRTAETKAPAKATKKRAAAKKGGAQLKRKLRKAAKKRKSN